MKHFKEFTKLYLAMNLTFGISAYLLFSLVNFSFVWPAEFYNGLTNGQSALLLTLLLFGQAWVINTTNEFLKRPENGGKLN